MAAVFREAKETDAFYLAEVQAVSWDAAYRGKISERCFESCTREKLIIKWSDALKKKNSHTILASEFETILGFINFGEYRDEDLPKDAVGEIRALYIHPSHFRKGIGKQLTQLAVRTCFDLGYTSVALWVLVVNEGAKLFYQKMGFSSDNTIKVDKRLTNCELKTERFLRRF